MAYPRSSAKWAHPGMARRPWAFALALIWAFVPWAAAGAVGEDAADAGAAAVEASAVAESEGAESAAAVVTVRRLNIRSGPGTRFRILRTVVRGAELPLLAIEDGWAKIDMEPVGWVLARHLRIPENFGRDPFVAHEDAFLDWAIGIEFLEEISLQDKGVIWVVLTPEGYVRPDRPVDIARRLACGYEERTGFAGLALVTVWPAGGPGERLVTEQHCDE